MSTSTSNPVPIFYRILFTYIDPVFCSMGAYLHLFAHPVALQGYSPHYHDPPSTETTVLLDTLAGFFLALGIMEAVLLRIRHDDRAVWRCVQGSVLLLDIVMVYAHSKALSVEGRWEIAEWSGDDWRNIAGNAGMGIARLACALGIGMGMGVNTKISVKIS